MSNQTTFKQEIILMFIQFLLIVVAGTVIGNLLQNKSWSYQNDLNKLDERRKASRAILMDLSSKIDNRLYKMRQCYWSIKNRKSANEIENRWDDYRVALDEWNSNLNKNLLNAKVYFGVDGFESFELIHRSIRDIGSSLDKIKRNEDYGNDMTSVKKEFEDINPLIESFYRNGVDRINEM